MSANPQDGAAFRVSKILGGFRRKATNGSGLNTSRAGAKPHGQKDKVMLPKKLILALPTSNQEPTLSARIGSGASPPTAIRRTPKYLFY